MASNDTPPPGVGTRYRVVRELGAGGMGSVYLAEDTQLRRKVAIKTIKEALAQDEGIRRRIVRECQLHAQIGTHPNIVTLYDRLEEDGRIALVMEFVEGQELQHILQQRAAAGQPMPWQEGVRIAMQVLTALDRIHAHDIVHRDIKPSNILVGRDDEGAPLAKLMDFGIARMQDDESATALTNTEGSGPGTPLYMAPEQIDPTTYGALSPGTDIYAMGVMLYQILSGQPPFRGSLTEIFNGHLNATPPPLAPGNTQHLPPALVETLHKAMAKHPRDRYARAAEFRAALAQTMGEVQAAPAEVTQAVSGVFDPAQTAAAGEMSQAAFDAGGTQLSTGGTGAGRRKGRTGMVVAIAAVLVVVAGGGAAAFFAFGGAAGAEGEGGNATAEGPATTDGAATSLAGEDGSVAGAAAEDATPAEDLATASGPPQLPDGAALPDGVTLPDGAEVPADAALTEGALDPAQAAALAGAQDEDEDIPDLRALRRQRHEDEQEAPFSAMEELRRLREDDADDAPAATPAPVAQPRPAARPQPTPEPEPQPAAQPQPQPKPQPRQQTAPPPPADDGGDGFKIKIIKKEDRRVD